MNETQRPHSHSNMNACLADSVESAFAVEQ